MIILKKNKSQGLQASGRRQKRCTAEPINYSISPTIADSDLRRATVCMKVSLSPSLANFTHTGRDLSKISVTTSLEGVWRDVLDDVSGGFELFVLEERRWSACKYISSEAAVKHQ